MENPYSQILNLLRNDKKETAPKNFMFGRVLSAEPLSLDVGGLTQTAGGLMINGALRARDKDGQLIDPLLPGERVLLLPYDDNQRFIVLCKVVST